MMYHQVDAWEEAPCLLWGSYSLLAPERTLAHGVPSTEARDATQVSRREQSAQQARSGVSPSPNCAGGHSLRRPLAQSACSHAVSPDIDTLAALHLSEARRERLMI